VSYRYTDNKLLHLPETPLTSYYCLENPIMAEEDRMVKMEVDYSDTVAKLIPECETLAADNKLNEAIDKLLVLEKQTRAVII
jgi:hypothetical protein